MDTFASVPEYIRYMQTHPETSCPIRRTLEVIGGKWKLFIVLQLFERPSLRFGELSRGVTGITNTMLSGCLRELERDGMVERRQFNEIPPRVEYSLTDEGRSLAPVLLALASWGMGHPQEGRRESEDDQ